ncbi:MAG TPA: FAD-dependent oxidoreductase, partial [Bacteroidia bacterium]|nr:FAD-dependent oxidoreductase [Bacteroidia bacterium]
PGFYRHITDTMKRIPAGNGKTVYDNLEPTEHIMIARYGKSPIEMMAHFPRTLKELEFAIHSVHGLNTGLTKEEIKFFAERVWQLMTSCYDRRTNDYERLNWWEYMQADRFSQAYQSLLVAGLTRTLVAAQAKSASTRTGGDIFIQLLFNIVDPFINADRVLNGPTNEAWLNHWIKYLDAKKNVKYTFGVTAVGINIANGQIDCISAKTHDGKELKIQGDYYVFAVPVEQFAPLINQDMLNLDSTLGYIKQLAPSVSWMNGIQFYLNTEVNINPGHIIFSDSEWAITCISQVQFWKGRNISEYGNGKVKSILSVDISDWFNKGINGKLASDCTRDEVMNEVWAEMEKSLNINGTKVIDKSMIIEWYLDRDIVAPVDTHLNIANPHEEDFNKEPLLVNRISTWDLRPDAHTEIPNLFLSGDYVRTFTDLATMEGANESARRAVNCIIQSSNSNAPLCKVWNLHEPLVLAPFKWKDESRYNKGLPWSPKLPLFARIIITLMKPIFKLISFFRKK